MIEFTNEVDLTEELSEEVKMEEAVKVIDCYMLNVRALPSANSQVRGLVSRGDELKVLSRNDEWVRVETHDGYVGYVMSKFVSG